MGIPHGIERVAFYAGDTVVRSDALEASQTEFEQREVETDQLDATGGRYYGGDYSRLRVRMQGLAALAQLRTWRDANTRVSVAVQGSGMNVLWMEQDRLSMVKPINVQGRAQGQADFIDVEIVREGHGAHSVHQLVNLLSHLPAASGSSYSRSITFPCAGARLTAAVTNTAGSGTLTLTARNSANGTLQTASTTLVNGRASCALVLPASTYSVLVTVAGGSSISNISLRSDGSTGYVAF